MRNVAASIRHSRTTTSSHSPETRAATQNTPGGQLPLYGPAIGSFGRNTKRRPSALVLEHPASLGLPNITLPATSAESSRQRFTQLQIASYFWIAARSWHHPSVTLSLNWKCSTCATKHRQLPTKQPRNGAHNTETPPRAPLPRTACDESTFRTWTG